MPMQHKSSALADLLLGIVIPSVILMKFSADDALGARNALIEALAFPVTYGLYELIRYKVTNYIALLGFVSVLLTGGIGLLELDSRWLAIKEAAIPGILGTAVLISVWINRPLIKVLVYNPKIFNTYKINQILEQKGLSTSFEKRLLNATYWLSGTFYFSAVMNYILATIIVTSPSGSSEFNEELGRLTLLSYPVIAIPSMLMMLAIVYFLWRSAHTLTGLKLEEMLAPSLTDES